MRAEKRKGSGIHTRPQDKFKKVKKKISQATQDLIKGAGKKENRIMYPRVFRPGNHH